MCKKCEKREFDLDQRVKSVQQYVIDRLETLPGRPAEDVEDFARIEAICGALAKYATDAGVGPVEIMAMVTLKVLELEPATDTADEPAEEVVNPAMVCRTAQQA